MLTCATAHNSHTRVAWQKSHTHSSSHTHQCCTCHTNPPPSPRHTCQPTVFTRAHTVTCSSDHTACHTHPTQKTFPEHLLSVWQHSPGCGSVDTSSSPQSVVHPTPRVFIWGVAHTHLQQVHVCNEYIRASAQPPSSVGIARTGYGEERSVKERIEGWGAVMWEGDGADGMGRGRTQGAGWGGQ
jgi:hypothetical protein